ncbi:hypothetical protein [Tahibacter sp.]|uniref:hypothetical protein n=1 Tax=Tahibacter sp. TaxID=2056211 RepID=UPI0028C4754F|nr:hypothetical protein [Tahibacter sp.]
MSNQPLSLFTFTSFIVPPTERRPRRAATGASRRLRRLLAAASANEVPDPSEHALVLDLHARLRQLAQAE